MLVTQFFSGWLIGLSVGLLTVAQTLGKALAGFPGQIYEMGVPSSCIETQGPIELQLRAAAKKINFVRKIMLMKVNNIARQALVEEGRLEALGMGFSGLAAETNELCRDLSISSTESLYKFVSKQDIKEAVQKKVYFENRQRMPFQPSAVEQFYLQDSAKHPG